MLDLNQLNQRYYEIKDLEGNVLQVKKPSQGFFNKLMEVRELSQDDVAKSITVLYETVRDIFNLNINGKQYDIEYFADLDVSVIVTVIVDYFGFLEKEMGE